MYVRTAVGLGQPTKEENPEEGLLQQVLKNGLRIQATIEGRARDIKLPPEVASSQYISKRHPESQTYDALPPDERAKVAATVNQLLKAGTGAVRKLDPKDHQYLPWIRIWLTLRDIVMRATSSPKPSARDARILRQARKLDSTIHKIGKSVTFLMTSAQQDLLKEIVAILGTFFPSRYGVIDKDGNPIKFSKYHSTKITWESLPRDPPSYYQHDTGLSLSYQKDYVRGRHKPFAPGNRNFIYLYAANLGSNTETLAEVLIHETVHMLSHRYRSIEETFGASMASGIPTAAAGALLDRSSFDLLQRTMEQHFLKLVDFLNGRPHRARGSFGQLENLQRSVAAMWGTHVVEEVLAYVFTERATFVLAQYQAGKTGFGLRLDLVPIQFLKDYFDKNWLSEPKDRAALKTTEADQLFSGMEVDLVKLVDAVQKHMGP